MCKRLIILTACLAILLPNIATTGDLPATNTVNTTELLSIIKKQQAAIETLQQQVAALTKQPPPNTATNNIESRLQHLEETIDEMNDPYTYESTTNRTETLRNDLNDLITRVAWIESTLRTIRIYGAP